MKIIFNFKGSIFGQKDELTLDLPNNCSVYEAIQKIATEIPSLQSLLFKSDAIRTDILILVDRTDVKALQMLDSSLEDGQVITILPLAHGG